MVPKISHIRPTIVTRCSDGESDGTGCCCSFFKINAQWGVKLYNTKSIRDDCSRNQKMAAKYKLAPKVGRVFQFLVDREMHFGFLTEVCPYIAYDVHWNTTLTDRHHKKGSGWSEWQPDCECDFCNWDERFGDVVSYDLNERMEEVGLSFGDNHERNWGWMDRPYGDHPVIIDFSEHM